MLVSLADSLISLVAPHNCIVCNREGRPVCDECIGAIGRPKKPVCFLCNSLSEDFKTCQTCRRKTALKRVWVAVRYEAYVKDLIRQYKFERQRAAYAPLAQMIEQVISARNYDLVTSVPCATSRFRKRGYNQSELIARKAAQDFGLPYANLLAKSGQSRQVGHSRKDRLEQIRNTIRPTKSSEGKRVLIVDDVSTTGATLDVCAGVLKHAGAKSVEAAVVAKA